MSHRPAFHLGLAIVLCACACKAAAAPEDMVDISRQKARDFTHWLGEEVNDWFGDKPFSEGGKVSRGRLGMHLNWDKNEGTSTRVKFRARFELPNLRDKAYIFLGRANEQELIADQPEAFTREQRLLPESQRTDQSGFFGLGFNLRDYLEFRAGVRGAIKPYVQTRYLRSTMLSASNRLEFRETVFWRKKDGFGSTTALDLEHAYSPSVSFKWQNAATITRETDGFAWSSSLGAYKTFGESRLLSLDALMNGETGAQTDVGEYGLRLKWIQPLHRDWLRAEFILGHFWPRGREDREREHGWAVGAGLEMHF